MQPSIFASQIITRGCKFVSRNCFVCRAWNPKNGYTPAGRQWLKDSAARHRLSIDGRKSRSTLRRCLARCLSSSVALHKFENMHENLQEKATRNHVRHSERRNNDTRVPSSTWDVETLSLSTRRILITKAFIPLERS